MRGHDLRAVLAALPIEAGGTATISSITSSIQIIRVDDTVIVTFDLSPTALASSTDFPCGLYLVGLVPYAEIANAEASGRSLAELVGSDSPTWRLMDSSAFQIFTI